MCHGIEEALTRAKQIGGKKAVEVRLGRRQFADFSGCLTLFQGPHPTPGVTHAYHNMPVREVDRESRRSVLFSDGDELILE